MKNTKASFSTWMKKYPHKFMILIFVIVIPVFILTGFFFSTIRNSNRFYFEKNGDDPVYLYKSNLTSAEELEEFILLDIKLTKITLPKENIEVIDDVEKVTYTGGKYEFEISYEKPANIEATYTFDFVLETPFGTDNHYKTSSSLSSNRLSINYNEVLPYSKYLFYIIERPNLYIKINMESNEIIPGLKTSDKIFYYKVDLSDLKTTVEQAR